MKKTARLISMLCLGALMLTSCGKKNTIHSVNDLPGKTIGVQLGTTGDTLAEDIENAVVEKYDRYSDAVEALSNEQIDAVIMDRDTASVFLEANRDVMLLSEGFADETYAIAVNKDNKELRDELNGALQTLLNDGTLRDIKEYYDGVNAGKKPYHSPENADRSKGKLIMATNSEFPPYEFKDGENVVGFDVDMMKAVCDKLGYELSIEDMAFDSILTAVKSRKADVGVAGISVTEKREKEVLFTDSYVTTHLVVMVKK